MDSQHTGPANESKEIETPEDVAVLYSWANLHGAKYRDFSASRREYRAEMRRRAAERQREEELRAKEEAEAAAAAAEAEAKAAQQAAAEAEKQASMGEKERALYELHEAQRRAQAERIEAERRAEAAKLAEADLLRAEHEMADAHASAQRQAARYAVSEHRRRQLAGPQPRTQVPGAISDPYTPENQQPAEVEHNYHIPMVPGSSRSMAALSRSREMPAAPGEIGSRRRPRTSQDSHAEHVAAQELRAEFNRADAVRIREEERLAQEEREARAMRAEAEARRGTGSAAYVGQEREVPVVGGRREDEIRQQGEAELRREADAWREEQIRRQAGDRTRREAMMEESRPLIAGRRDDGRSSRPRGFHPDDNSGEIAAYRRPDELPRETSARQFIPPSAAERSSHPADPVHQAEADRYVQDISRTAAPAHPAEPARAATDLPLREQENDRSEPAQPPARPADVRTEYSRTEPQRRPSGESRYMGASSSRSSIRLPDDLLERMGSVRPAGTAPLPPAQEPEPVGPAWLYPDQDERRAAERAGERSGLHRARQDYTRAERPGAPLSPIDDTLQQSRERVAARWYALKGVFESGSAEQQPEIQTERRKDLRTPMLAVFSMVGGVGRTSLVATLGRTLSSLGEKVLLTDTTTHSMLPFYFGASELRPGVVRTFSPPSGSTDAQISCVSYEADHRGSEQVAQDWFGEELMRSSRGMQRILLDLSSGSGWVIRRMARMSPTVLVPVAPDMNSVIGLQSIERFFAGIEGGNGRQIEPYFVLNQFDASLPLHLDVREVLRRQLGDRLLPFVIRRAPAVPEALAEGMTVVDYAPDAAVSSDYMNVATWLRAVAAPATAGFRNLRWSER